MADWMMIPPPRVTSRQTQASLRASALRSSFVAAPPMPIICSTSGPSSTSMTFPNRPTRLAPPPASGPLPLPQRCSLVVTREISADVEVRMDDGPQAASRSLGRFQGVQKGLRLHDVSVALGARAGGRTFFGPRDIGDRVEPERASGVR